MTVPKKRIYMLAEKKAMQKLRKATDAVQEDTKNILLKQKLKLAIYECVAVQRARADFEREEK